MLECAHFIILLCSTCAHYTMEGAYKNDVKQLTILCTFVFTFTIGFSLWVLQSPPLIYALSSVHYVYIYNKNFKNPQKDAGIIPVLHPHAPK
jgi:hypothetical protein